MKLIGKYDSYMIYDTMILSSLLLNMRHVYDSVLLSRFTLMATDIGSLINICEFIIIGGYLLPNKKHV